MQVGEYIILAITPIKNVLGRVVKMDKERKKYQAVLEKDSVDGQNVPFDFKLAEVVAYLGRSPKAGSAYGVQVEPLRERIDHSYWGEIRIFAEIDDNQRKAIRLALKLTKEKLAKMRMPQLPLTVEIREQKGKLRGFYKHKPKAEFDTLCAKIDEGVSEMDYIVSHEYAHGIWFRHMTPKQRMSWVRLYHDAITLNDVAPKELKAILEDLKSNGDLRSYAKEVEEETLLILKAVFRHISQVHSITRQHFEMALMLGDDVSVYWPKSVELSEKNVLLTEYSKRSPEELWAEAFALHFTGKKLPSKIHDLLDRHMRTLVK
jgi:hypothetical protein